MACPSSVQPRDRYVPTPLVDVPRTCSKLMRFFAIANTGELATNDMDAPYPYSGDHAKF